MNLLDIGGILLFLLFSFFVFKRYWFYSLYSFLRFLIFSFFSLSAGLFIASINPVSFFLTKLQIALLITGILFVLLWRFVSFKKIFFFLDTHLFKIDRFVYFHKLNKVLNVLPTIIAAGFFTFFLFSTLVSISPLSNIIEHQIEGSKVLKPLSYKIYFSPLALGTIKPFQGTLFKLPPAISIKSKEILAEIRRPDIISNTGRINEEREKVGLPPIQYTEQTPTEDTPSQNPQIPPQQIPSTPSIPNQIPNPDQPTTPPSNPQTPPPSDPNTPAPTATPFPTSPPIPTQAPQDTNSIEQELFRLTNQKRSDNGVAALSWSEEIAVVARAHSNDMNNRNYFSHNSPEGVTPFQRLTLGGVSYSTAGENIAAAGTAEMIIEAWMNSSGHRANILNPSFRRIGIGVAQNSGYSLIATQNFTN